MPTHQKLRLGLIADPRTLLGWQAECIRILLDSDMVELKLIATCQEVVRRAPEQKFHPKLRSNSLLLDSYLRITRNSCRASQIVNFSGRTEGVEHIVLRLTLDGESGLIVRDDDVAKICNYDLDFILLFDPPMLGGGIYRAARYGVWCFRFGDGVKCGDPAAFWEIYSGAQVTKAALHRLTEHSGTATILYTGYFPTIAWSWHATRDLVLFSCAEWPARVCRDILNQSAAYLDGKPSNFDPHLQRNPTNWEMVLAGIRMGKSFAQAQLRAIILREQWHIGIVRAPIQSFIEPNHVPPVEWLPGPPRTRFFADPFAIRRGAELTILFEDFDQIENSGHISAMHSIDGGLSFTPPTPVRGSAFDTAKHKSYPYLFEYGGEIFCVPETCGTNEINLYRAAQFPWQWERAGTILTGISAVDPTVFLHDGSWWMFFTLGGSGSNIKLYLAFASDLLGPWSLHPANPVKTDISSARPGGTPFLHEGVLYRPAQNSSSTYGGSLVIHQVEKLTRTEYQERFVCNVTPQHHGRYSGGFHTLAAAGDVCVVDGKRYVVLPELLPAMLKQKIGSVIRRLLGN